MKQSIVTPSVATYVPSLRVDLPKRGMLEPGRGSTCYWPLLERLHKSYESFDLVVRQAFCRFHFRFLTIFDSFLDGLKRFFVCNFGLHLSVGEVLGAGFLSHFGLGFAIRPVAFL